MGITTAGQETAGSHNKCPGNSIKLKLDDDIKDIICYKKDPTLDNWKIALPEEMVLDTVKWFHQVMGHLSQDGFDDTLKQHYSHSTLCQHIDNLKCQDCQWCKLPGHGFGLLPKREVHIPPW